MKKLTRQIFIMCACIMLCGMTSNATSADKTTQTNSQAVIKAPFLEISDIYFNKKNVTKNEKLQYRFTLSFVDTFDYDSEEFSDGPFRYDMYEVTIYWKSSKRQKIVRSYKWPGNQKSITIEDTISIKDGIQSGEWTISDVRVSNYNASEDDEDVLCICHTEKEDEIGQSGHNWLYTDLSPLSFNVTGVKKKADEKAPTIVKNSMSLSKTKIKKKKKSTFSVKIKDASEIKEVTCIWDEKTKYGTDDTYLTMKYNSKTKKYQCKYVMKPEVKKAQLSCITTEDIYGNIKYYMISDKKVKKKYGKNFSKMVIYRKK